MAAFEENARDVARVGGELSKPQKFRRHQIRWENQLASSNICANCRWTARRSSASRDWNEFHDHMDEKQAARAGRALHGLRRSVLPHRHAHQRHGQRLPDQQPHPRVERPRLSRPVAGSARPPAQDEQLSPSSPAASARRRAKARACSASTSRRSRSRTSSAPIIDKGWEEGWVIAEPPDEAHRQEGRRHRLRPRRSRRRRAAQQGRPHGHRLRARRSHRRAADVRHPEHEARQERGRRCAASS